MPILSKVEVDAFLTRSGLEPVRKECYLWALPSEPSETARVMVGDTRAENFKLTPAGRIAPIDIRVWLAAAAAPVHASVPG